MSYVNLDTSRNNCLKRVSSEATLGKKTLLRPSAIGGMQLAWRQPTSDVTISMKFGHA
jgi:hypothetical protein